MAFQVKCNIASFDDILTGINLFLGEISRVIDEETEDIANITAGINNNSLIVVATDTQLVVVPTISETILQDIENAVDELEGKLDNLLIELQQKVEPADLSAIETLLEQIENNTDELEVKIDNVNLNTDTLEQKLQDLLDEVSTEAKQDTQIAQVGEVQASPTANTVLERLKQIHDRIGDIAVSPAANTLQDRIKYLQTQFDLKITELRDAIQGTPAKSLSDIYTAVDELEARIGAISLTPATNTLQDRLKNIYAAVDELEPRIGEISLTPTANTVLERLKQVQDRIGEVSVTPTAYTVQDRLKTLTTLITSSSQDTTGSGPLTALNQTVTLTDLQSKSSVGIDISGTFSAKLVCEGSIDGTTWLQLELYESKYLAPFSGSIKTTGQFHADIAGFLSVRIRVSSYTSGTVVVSARASNAILDPAIHGSLWQRFSLAGRGFAMTTDLITISGTAEVDFVLMKNPAGTEKTIRLYEILLNIGLAGGVQSLKSTYRLYRNPTITVNGTSITAQKANPLGTFNPILEVYTSPTISARGSLIQTFPFTQGVLRRELDLARYIIDGANLLITAEPATTNTEHAVSSAWAEVEA